jgi:hypothetical protein
MSKRKIPCFFKPSFLQQIFYPDNVVKQEYELDGLSLGFRCLLH